MKEDEVKNKENPKSEDDPKNEDNPKIRRSHKLRQTQKLWQYENEDDLKNKDGLKIMMTGRVKLPFQKFFTYSHGILSCTVFFNQIWHWRPSLVYNVIFCISCIFF